MKLPERVMKIFLKTSNDRINEIERILGGLHGLQENPENKESCGVLFGLFHKFHGALAMYGFKDAGEVAGEIENYLGRCLKGEEELSGKGVEKIVEAKEKIKKAILNNR